jgi:S-adenosylmethionine synthetase
MTEHTEPHLFTSESVTEGHPDKVADQISDSILDAILAADPMGRVACETLVATGLVVLAGEITADDSVRVNFSEVARQTIRDIGYTRVDSGFDADSCGVVVAVGRQSADIAMGVDTGGAGDQGLMFGYACRETPQLMPLPIMLAHGLTQRLARARKSNEIEWLRPDGKSQVTIEYEGTRPVRVHTVVVSTHHARGVPQAEIRERVIEEIVRPTLPARLLDARTIFHVNPTGAFEIGGPQGDCGLTGRKIIVDTYGGSASHGGGAFSGKDPTKVDRSACYMARYIAKNLVAAGLAERANVQLAYAIGVADPVSVHVETDGTGAISDRLLERLVRDAFPLTPRGIIEHLQLRRPIYKATAAYGHFGRTGAGFTWEDTSRAAELRDAAGVGGELPAMATV